MKIELNKNLSFENWDGEITLRSLTQPYAFEDYEIFKNSELIDLLEFLSDPREKNEVIEVFVERFDLSREEASDNIEDLIREGVLWQLSDKKNQDEKSYYNLWQGNLRVPSLYHQKTNNLPKFDYLDSGESDDIEMMRRYVKEEVSPSNYKIYEHSKIISLTRSLLKASDQLSLDLLFSLSEFNNHSKELNLDNLGEFLYLLLGQMGKRSLHVTGEQIAKTSPSGGARHPTEGYVEILDIEGIDPGLYHYNVKDHTLELLKSEVLPEDTQLRLYRYSHSGGYKANFIIYFTCIFDRSMFRYRESRSYRVMQIDLGHLMQTGSFLCKNNGWGNFRSYAPPETLIEERIGLSDYSESLMAILAVGRN